MIAERGKERGVKRGRYVAWLQEGNDGVHGEGKEGKGSGGGVHV